MNVSAASAGLVLLVHTSRSMWFALTCIHVYMYTYSAGHVQCICTCTCTCTCIRIIMYEVNDVYTVCQPAAASIHSPRYNHDLVVVISMRPSLVYTHSTSSGFCDMYIYTCTHVYINLCYLSSSCSLKNIYFCFCMRCVLCCSISPTPSLHSGPPHL